MRARVVSGSAARRRKLAGELVAGLVGLVLGGPAGAALGVGLGGPLSRRLSRRFRRWRDAGPGGLSIGCGLAARGRLGPLPPRSTLGA